jgi:hypothetical protein
MVFATVVLLPNHWFSPRYARGEPGNQDRHPAARGRLTAAISRLFWMQDFDASSTSLFSILKII